MQLVNFKACLKKQMTQTLDFLNTTYYTDPNIIILNLNDWQHEQTHVCVCATSAYKMTICNRGF